MRVVLRLSQAAADGLRAGGPLVLELHLPADVSATLDRKAAAYRSQHPAASANEIYRAVGSGHRRADVLAAVLRVRAAEANTSPVQAAADAPMPVPRAGTGIPEVCR